MPLPQAVLLNGEASVARLLSSRNRCGGNGIGLTGGNGGESVFAIRRQSTGFAESASRSAVIAGGRAGSVSAGIEINLFLQAGQLQQFSLRGGARAAYHIVVVARHCNRGEDAHDNHCDHQLDQAESVNTMKFHYLLLKVKGVWGVGKLLSAFHSQ